MCMQQRAEMQSYVWKISLCKCPLVKRYGICKVIVLVMKDERHQIILGLTAKISGLIDKH